MWRGAVKNSLRTQSHHYHRPIGKQRVSNCLVLPLSAREIRHHFPDNSVRVQRPKLVRFVCVGTTDRLAFLEVSPPADVRVWFVMPAKIAVCVVAVMKRKLGPVIDGFTGKPPNGKRRLACCTVEMERF